jgi:DNA polymerase-3 subunit alpha
MDGLCTPYELLMAGQALGQTAMAITDHGTLSSHRDMQIAAKELGMKPILGLEAYISATDRFDKRDVKKREDNTSVYNHIILLAKDQAGLKNLQKMSEIAWTEGYYYKPRIDMELLDEHGDGIIVISGCMNGLIAKAIDRGDLEKAKEYTRWFKNRFGDDFYMEIQAHNPADLNYKLLELADEFGVKPVVTSDAHFDTPEQRALEEILLIISTKPKMDAEATYESGKKKKNIFERLNHLYPDRPISFEEIDVYIQGRDEIKKSMLKQGIDRDDLYNNTLEIESKIGDYEFYEGLELLPKPKNNANDELRKLCKEALEKLAVLDTAYGTDYSERLEEELQVIKDKDFASYFLVVADMVGWAKDQDIMVGPGRGSAAGSLVCYLLGITDVDPIQYDLLFFRFINPERNDFPDIDTDFMDRRRGEVKDYLRTKFKHVASISTFQYFKDKGVVRDVGRTFGVPLGEINKALKGIETFEDLENNPNADWFRDKYPEVMKYASMLRGKIRAVGMHAAGVVVSKEPISNYVPIETRKDPDDSVSGRISVVGYDMEHAANIGLIKLDVLGLKSLSVIKDTLDIVKSREGREIDLHSLQLNDPKIFKDLSNGYTRGVFQAEATPYTNLLIKMGVDNFEDLVASNALVRPGAMNTVGGAYVGRKRGTEMVQHVHPIMQDFTKNTYGVIIYQEQVMQACVHLGGMTWAEADKVRKIIGKKKDAREFDIFRDKFVEGASKHIAKEDAEHLWHDFEAHAGYSFNSILKNEKDKDARTEYLLEAKRLGIKVLLPHVNESESGFSIQGTAIRFGLGDIKYISDNISSKLIANRPYKNYAHLLEVSTTKGSGINTRAIESLNAIGGASFKDNPRLGNENDNLYEYLTIPKFDIQGLSPKVKAQIQPLEEFLEQGCYILMAMVRSIKKGKGWSRVELVDDTGAIGIFHSENTQIETGNMYFFLVGDNRIHRYVEITDIIDKKDDPFINWLYRDEINIPDEKYLVVDFTHYKTKTNKMMAHIILSNNKKELLRVLAFPTLYSKALGKMKPGSVCEPLIKTSDEDTIFIKEIN